MAVIKVKSKTQDGEIWAYWPGYPGQKNTLLEKDPLIAMAYGERANGKTYSMTAVILFEYLFHKFTAHWVRKDEVNFEDPDILKLFDAVMVEGFWVDKKNIICTPDTEGARHVNVHLEFGWEGVEYRGGRRAGWYLYRYDDTLDKNIYDDKPFCTPKVLRLSRKRKGGNSGENIKWVVFDEFLDRDVAYIQDEPGLWANLMKTIARYGKKARFVMLANTVTKRSEYFKAFGLKVDKVEQGKIHHIRNSKDDYMSIEYVEHKEGYVKPSDSYMEFFHMNSVASITNGSWEVADYYTDPDLEFRPKDVRKKFFILYDGDCVKCQVIKKDHDCYLYVSANDEAVDEDHDLIFSDAIDMRRNWIQSMFLDPRWTPIVELIKRGKITYDVLDSGEIVNDYLKYCKSYSIIKA